MTDDLDGGDSVPRSLIGESTHYPKFRASTLGFTLYSEYVSNVLNTKKNRSTM